MDIERGVLEGNKRAIARLITLVESGDFLGNKIYSNLYKRVGRAKKIGITGPPGAGKSTLLDELVHLYLEDGKRAGVIAVDPTSPFTGGAILGDRIRMKGISTNENCFVRSMASRGALGGLSRGVIPAVDILDAAGYDYIFIETVGTGQSEVDIVKLSDLVLLVTVPDLGDDIQAFKAGIMEIGDIIVINKSDREGADRSFNMINSMLSLKAGRKPRILMTDCLNRKGLRELKEEINLNLDYRMKNGEIGKRRDLKELEELKRSLSELIVKMSIESPYFNEVMRGIRDKDYSPEIGANMLIKYLFSQEGDYDK